MPLNIGDKAPDFTLKSKRGEMREITLSANFGKRSTVLLFFPLAFTSVCTQELCEVSAALDAYANLNADVIGISVDSPFAQEAWADKERITITLASDLNRKTAAAYGVLLEDLAGLGSASARAAFVIDAAGIIQYAEQTPTPKELPNLEAVQAKLAELSVSK